MPISPYSIAYGALVPKRGECANLFAPVACSATHIAYGSIRMEPVFMILGQSAATAAVLAIDGDLAVQDVPYAALRERLSADGQVLEHASSKETPKGHGAGKSPESLPGVTVDDDAAERTGAWKQGSANGGFIGSGYHHDDKGKEGPASAKFTANILKAGKHEVFVAVVPNANRATKAKVRVVHAGGQTDLVVNLTKGPADHLVSLGTYDFSDKSAASVIISNEGAEGYVVIDAVNWQAR